MPNFKGRVGASVSDQVGEVRDMPSWKVRRYMEEIERLLDEGGRGRSGKKPYLQWKVLRQKVEARLRVRSFREGKLVFNDSTFKTALDKMLTLPENDSRRLVREEVGGSTYYYLNLHQNRARRQMLEDGILPPPDSFRREHTLEVRPFLEQWEEVIPPVSLEFQCIDGYLPLPPPGYIIADESFAPPLRECVEELDVEKSTFFTSCIPEHGELGREIMEYWASFKKEMSDFAQMKRALIVDIRRVMEEKLDLPLRDRTGFPDNRQPCFTWNYLVEMYRYCLYLVKQGKSWLAPRDFEERVSEEIRHDESLDLYIYEPCGIWTLIGPAGRSAEEVLVEQERLRDDIMEEMRKGDFEERAERLRVKMNAPENLRIGMLSKIEEMKSMACLPAICSLMRRA